VLNIIIGGIGFGGQSLKLKINSGTTKIILKKRILDAIIAVYNSH
jgi:hypothetical protein